MDLAQKIKAFRGERSQADIAKALGCTHQLVSQMEKGERPGRSMLRPLIEVLGLTVEERRELIAWVLGFTPDDLDAVLGLDADAA